MWKEYFKHFLAPDLILYHQQEAFQEVMLSGVELSMLTLVLHDTGSTKHATKDISTG